MPISRNELERHIAEGRTINEIAPALGCCRNTIMNYMKKWDIATPKGFFATGKKKGRPKGTKQPAKAVELMRERYKGNGNPFYNRKHTDDTKQKMSQNHADFTGNKNPYKKALDSDPEKRQEASLRMKLIWEQMDDDTKTARSTKLSLAICNSEFHKNFSSVKHHQNGHLKTLKAGRIFYRSSWEKDVAIFLENNSLVKTFSSEPFAVHYKDNEKERHTRPDFLVECVKETYLIEVKPEALVSRNKTKIDAMRDYATLHNMRFLLISEPELTQIRSGINVLDSSQ